MHSAHTGVLTEGEEDVMDLWYSDSGVDSCPAATLFEVNTTDSLEQEGPSINEKLMALRLTRARLWLLCELLTALSDDHSVPLLLPSQRPLLDTAWRKAWFSAVQTPLNACISRLDGLMDENAASIGQHGLQKTKTIRDGDAARLTTEVRNILREMSDCMFLDHHRDGHTLLQSTGTTPLTVGQLCDDLRQDLKVPSTFAGRRSLLNQEVDISRSKRNANKALTKDLKHNLNLIQAAMMEKAKHLLGRNNTRGLQATGGKAMLDCCYDDAEKVDEMILVPFANECDRWNPIKSLEQDN